MRFLFESSLLLHPAPSLALWPSLKSLCNYKLPFFVYLYDLMTAGIRLVAFCVFLACVCAPAPGQAQTPDAGKIIDAYLKAAGGARALSRVQTLSIEGTVAGVGDANSGTYTFDTKLPNRYYTELILGGKSVIESYNGKSAWREDSSGSPVTMFGQESVDMQAEAQFANLRLLNLKKNKVAAAFIGQERVRDRDALHVELTSATGVKHELFFDSQTHLPLKESFPVGGITEEIYYSDYRRDSGIEIAHQIELRRGGDAYTIALKGATVNGPIGERVFDLPLKSQIKLPDLKALFKELDDNQKAIDKIRENYAGTTTEDETEYESDGKVKKHTVTESTFFYMDGDEISQVVKKDGKDLTPEEKQKEADDANKRVAEIQKRQEKNDSKEEKEKEEGKKDKDEGDGDVGIEIFLRACEFVNPRRERFRGQDVLVFDFEGNPEYKPKNLAEKIVQKLAGAIWVDEKAHSVARLEAYFVGDAKIAGGLLANIQKGTGFVFEQEFINNEVWLPTYEEAHIGVRVLLVKGFRVTDVTCYSDYKRYHVEATSAVAPPKQPD
jgi:outer membrane lipoprotein-sorting protein